ncbi:UNVERIFIED_CONTAM: hypothetical protein FKN15_025270 [Acipenser sinensis]
MLRSRITSDTDLYYDTSCKESIAIHRDTVNRSSPGYRTTAPSMPLHPRAMVRHAGSCSSLCCGLVSQAIQTSITTHHVKKASRFIETQ